MSALVGVACALTSLAMSTTALLIQKHSAVVEKDVVWFKRWRFFSGVGLNLLSEVTLSPLAIYLAPLALIAPLGGFGMIFNGVLTHFGLVCGIRERMSFDGWLSTIAICGGVGLVTLSTGTEASVVITQAAMPAILLRWRSVVLFVTTFSLIVSFMLIVEVPKLVRLRPHNTQVISAGRALCAGASGSYSVAMVRLLTNAIADFGAAGGPQPVLAVVLLLLATVAPTQLYILNGALASDSATLVIPNYVRSSNPNPKRKALHGC